MILPNTVGKRMHETNEQPQQAPPEQPRETLHQRLKRRSKERSPEGGRFVKMNPSDLGPISFMPLPKLPDEPPEE